MATWSRKPSTGTHTSFGDFPIPIFGLSSDFCSQLLPLRGCAVIFLCHVQSAFGVLALCSHFSNHSGIWFLTSFHDRQWSSLRFSVPSSLLQPSHTSSGLTNHCRRIFSAPILLPQPVSSSHDGACLSTLRWASFAAWLGLAPATAPSFNSSHSWLAAQSLPPDHPGFLQKHLFHVPASTGSDNKRKNLVRDMKEKERMRRAL